MSKFSFDSYIHIDADQTASLVKYITVSKERNKYRSPWSDSVIVRLIWNLRSFQYM